MIVAPNSPSAEKHSTAPRRFQARSTEPSRAEDLPRAGAQGGGG